jgi:hypothetical protein
MSSKRIIPGTASRVVNGYAAISGFAFVSAATSDDFPVLGGPTRAI